jgi:hypothetical protein
VIIKTTGILEDTLRNLSGEIRRLLMEEKQRHKRYVDHVHVAFQLETTQTDKRKLRIDRQITTMSGTETIDIRNEDKFRNLPSTVLYFFLAKPCFNAKNFKITKLSFLLKDFKPM